MPGTDYRNGATFQSRTADFSGAIAGNGGSNYTVRQSPPPVLNSYQPSSVLSPIGGSGNGMSGSTYAANRALNNY